MSCRAALVVGFWLWPFAVHAVTFNVATSGVDGPGCGAAASPCRTITQALGSAVAGDRIVVHPGNYSDDVDGDGTFGEPGEEVLSLNFGPGIRIESTDGAVATAITRRSTAPGQNVNIAGDGVQFGRLNKGFTLRVSGGVNTTGLSVTGGTGIVVAGNVMTGPVNIGFGVLGGTTLRDNRVLCSSTASGLGFFVALGTGIVMDRNLVQGCNQGFIAAGSDIVIERNLAIANGGPGFNLGDFAEFTRNAAIGNSGAGVTFNSGSTPGLFTMNTRISRATPAAARW